MYDVMQYHLERCLYILSLFMLNVLCTTFLPKFYLSAYQKINFLFLNQAYIMGTQKNHLNETVLYAVGTQKNRINEMVLLSIQNICSNCWIRKYLQFYTQKFFLSKQYVLLTCSIPVISIYELSGKKVWILIR